MKISTKLTLVSALLFCVFTTNNASAAELVFTRNLTIGTQGDDVAILQKFLIDNGFFKISTTTGYFGTLTKSALSKWQESVGIFPASGFFGPISRGVISIKTIQPNITIPPAILTTATSSTLVVGTLSTSTAATNDHNGSPIRIQIPKINVDAAFQYNGLKSDGTMEIPNNVTDVGWFTGSVHPGEKGTSVITGHVAQIRGGIVTKPGVFFNLKDLRVGDSLAVTNDKGESTTFVVRETRNYDPSANATDVFVSKDSNAAHLNIITCEGTWHPDQLSYSQRLVIFTDALK